MKAQISISLFLLSLVFLGCSKPADYLYYQPAPPVPPPPAQKPKPPPPTGPGKATQEFYACGNGYLYTIEVATGKITNVVQTTYKGHMLDLNDMAIDISGTIYGKQNNTNGIYIINATTGVGTQLIASIPNGFDPLAGLTMMPNGDLATFDMHGHILHINLTTLSWSVFTNTNYSMVGGDIKLLPDGFIYWTVSNETSQGCQNSFSGTQALVRIDPNTKAMVELGCLDHSGIFGLGFANGAIYGFSGDGYVLQVNVKNAALNAISSTGTEFVGAASNPALW